MLGHKTLDYSFSQIIEILEFNWLTSTYLFGWKRKRGQLKIRVLKMPPALFLLTLSLVSVSLSHSVSPYNLSFFSRSCKGSAPLLTGYHYSRMFLKRGDHLHPWYTLAATELCVLRTEGQKDSWLLECSAFSKHRQQLRIFNLRTNC